MRFLIFRETDLSDDLTPDVKTSRASAGRQNCLDTQQRLDTQRDAQIQRALCTASNEKDEAANCSE